MKKTAFLTVSLIALTLGAAACAPKVAEPVVEAPPASVAPAPMADMPMPAATAAAEPIVGTGKVVEIDAKAGTIKLDHGPIAALDWPAMSMTFTATV